MMFKKIRILILLMVLLVVAINSFYDKNHNWKKPTYILLVPINVDNSQETQRYIDTLTDNDLKEIDIYMKKQAEHYQKNVAMYYRFGKQATQLPPEVPRNGGILDAMIWSLKFRYYAYKNRPDFTPTPDLTLFLQYHRVDKKILTETSTALQNGRIGVVNLFASKDKTKNNHVVIAHESLHGFGATDKYNLTNGIPMYPHGYANPTQNPLFPQKQAELMAVHIPTSETKFTMARELKQTVIGEMTAVEVGWVKLP